MKKEKAASNSKSIEALKKELTDMHKQFDNIDIEKTLASNEPINKEKKLEKNKTAILKQKSKVETQKTNLTPVKKTVKPTSDTELDSKKVNNTLYKVPKEQKTNNKTDGSFLTIKEKLEKIKQGIKEKENSKTFDVESKNETSNKVKPKSIITEEEIPTILNINKTKLDEKRDKRNSYIIITLILVIIILTGVFFMFFNS